MITIKGFILLVAFLMFLNIGSSKTIDFKSIGTRIVGGTNATKIQFPYYAQIVTVIKKNDSKIGFGNCGGSLISTTHILTAAHCVENVLSLRIVLGFYTMDDRSDVEAHDVKSVNIHSEYNPTIMSNDIALIELAKPTTFTDNIKPIRFSCNYAEPETKTVVAGTGLTDDVEKKLSPNLLWTNLTTISNEQCIRVFKRIETSNICAYGKPKQGACRGDSGTALIKDENGSQIQIGLLSWGAINNCERGYPTVFTRISDYIVWIKQNANVSCVDETSS